MPPASSLVSCSAYVSALKMETIYSSETSVDSQWTTRHFIPKIIHFCAILFLVIGVKLTVYALLPALPTKTSNRLKWRN
jgi:hypothetical protein